MKCPRKKCAYQWRTRVAKPKECPECKHRIAYGKGAPKDDDNMTTTRRNIIISVVKAFGEVNPAASKWYANTTQRASAERLVALHGLEQVLKVVTLLPRTNTMPYFPSINTPAQLEEKWSALESALIRKKNEVADKGRGIA